MSPLDRPELARSYNSRLWIQKSASFICQFTVCHLDEGEILVLCASRSLVVRTIWDGKPWFLAEVKYHKKSIGPALNYYQKQLDAPFAFQIIIDADYVDADCFARAGGPVVVPAQTLLSQLL